MEIQRRLKNLVEPTTSGFYYWISILGDFHAILLARSRMENRSVGSHFSARYVCLAEFTYLS